MKIDIHILTHSAGLLSDNAGVKTPEGEYSPPVVAFSNLLQSTIDSNTSPDNNLNTKNSTSTENSTRTIHVGEPAPNDHMLNQPGILRQAENVLETSLQTPSIIGFKRIEHPVNNGHKNLKTTQSQYNIEDKNAITTHYSEHSAMEKNRIHSGNRIEKLQDSNSKSIDNPLKASDNLTNENLSAMAIAKEKFVEIESMIRDFKDSMKVQTKGKVHINLLSSHVDDVQVRVDISNTSKDEIPHIMNMIVQNLWIPMRQKNQLSSISDTKDTFTVQYDNAKTETNFEHILHSEYKNAYDGTNQIKNHKHQPVTPLNLKKNVYSESSEHISPQITTDFDADNTINQPNHSKTNSTFHEHNVLSENRKSVTAPKQEVLSYDRFNDTADNGQISIKSINHTQNDDAITNLESSFNKKPGKVEKDNSPKELMLPEQEKKSYLETLKYTTSSPLNITPSHGVINSDSHNQALQTYIQKLFPEVSAKAVNNTHSEKIQILENMESSLVANTPIVQDNQRIALETLTAPFTVNSDLRDGKNRVTKENISNANVESNLSLDLKERINQEIFQGEELYQEADNDPETYAYKDKVQTNSTKNLSAANSIILNDKPHDSRSNSLDIRHKLSESGIDQSETETKNLQSEVLHPNSPKMVRNSQENIDRVAFNQTEYERKEEGNVPDWKKSASSGSKENPFYSKDSISLNYRSDNVIDNAFQQDIVNGDIKNNGLSVVKNYREELSPNMFNDKSVDEAERQELAHSFKQSVTITPISENKDDATHSDSKVSVQLKNNISDKTLVMHTKEVVQDKVITINSAEAQNLNSDTDTDHSKYISKDISALEDDTVILQRSRTNSIVNDESLNKNEVSSVKSDNYSVKVKQTASENISIGLTNKVQNRVAEVVALESENITIIREEQKRTAEKNVTDQRKNSFIPKELIENPKQNSEFVEASDNALNTVKNQRINYEQSSENHISDTSQNEQKSQSLKVGLATETKGVSHIHSDEEKTFVKNVTDRRKNSAIPKQSSENLIQKSEFGEASHNAPPIVKNHGNNDEQSSENHISDTSQNEQKSQSLKVGLATETKGVSHIHSGEQKTIEKNVIHQSKNSFIPIQSNENLIQKSEFGESADNTPIMVQNHGKITEQTSDKHSVHVTDKEQNMVSEEVVTLAIESDDISKIRGEFQKSTEKKAANPSNNQVVTQDSSAALNQKEKLRKVVQDSSLNIKERQEVKSENTILPKSVALPENSQIPENIDVYKINDEIIEKRTSYSQLINSHSAKIARDIDSPAQTKHAYEAITVHKENQTISKAEPPIKNYRQSREILESVNQTELTGKEDYVYAEHNTRDGKNLNNGIEAAIDDSVLISQDIHVENSVEDSDAFDQNNTSLSSNEKKSVKPERYEVVNTEKILDKSDNVSSSIRETEHVKIQSDHKSERTKTMDENQQPVNKNEKSDYVSMESEIDSKNVYERTSEIDSVTYPSVDEKIQYVDDNLLSYKDSDAHNVFIAAKTINDRSAELTNEQQKRISQSLKTNHLHKGQKNNIVSESPQSIADNRDVIVDNVVSEPVVSQSSVPSPVADELKVNESDLFYNIFYGDRNETIVSKTIHTEFQKPEKLVRDNDVNTPSLSLQSPSHDKIALNQKTENEKVTGLSTNENVVSDSAKIVQSSNFSKETLQKNVKEAVDSHVITYNDLSTEYNNVNQQNLHTPKTTAPKNKTATTINNVNSENIQTEISSKVDLSVNNYNNASDKTGISSKYTKTDTENIHNRTHKKNDSVTGRLPDNDDDGIVKNSDTPENPEIDENSASHIVTETKSDNFLHHLTAERNLHPPLQTSDGTVYVLKNKNLDNAAIVITPPSEFQSLGQAVPNTAMALHSIIEKASSVGVSVKNIVFKIRYNDAISPESTGVVSNTINKKDVNQGVDIPKINTLNEDDFTFQNKPMVSAKSVDSPEFVGIIKNGIGSNHINVGVEKKSDKKVAISREQNSHSIMLEGVIKKSENTSQQNSTKQENNLLKKDYLSYHASLKNSLSNDNVEKSVSFSDNIAHAVSERAKTMQREGTHIMRSNNDVPNNSSADFLKQDSLDSETELQMSLSQNSSQSLGMPDSFSHSVNIENTNSTSREDIVMPQNVHIQPLQKNGATTLKKATSMEMTDPLPVHHFAEKAHEYISSKAQGDGTVRMVLQPEELGTVIVRYSTQSADAQLHIQVDSQQTKQIIESQLPQLKDQFGKQGMQLDNVEVSVRKKEEEMSNSSQYSQNRQGQSQQEQESRQQFTRSFKYAADARKAQTTVNYNTSAFNKVFQSQK